jgi:8-amino-3,8-dideoxy-alpha-D-manno-octulosonate transaminase
VSTTTTLAIDGGTPVRTSYPPLGKGAAVLGDDERAAVLEVLESKSLFRYYGTNFLGRTAAFEADVVARLDVGHAVATSSGTAALRTALAALGVGCGDEVVVPAFTFIATVNAVVISGAVPVFAEIDDTLNIDAADVASKITERTAAVMPVHLENVACDMDALLAVTMNADVPVIEDAAQSLGASYRGRALGTLGDIGAFSLQVEKNITAGEGGIVVTNDDRLFERAARYQDQGGQFFTSHGGGRGEMEAPFVGENLRMTEIAAAIAGVQLKKLEGMLAAMRTNHSRVLDAVGDIDGLAPRRIVDPAGDGGSSATWFAPSPELARRFVAALRAERIPAAQMYNGQPVYATPSILERRTVSEKGGPWNCAEHPAQVDYRMGMCPRTESLAARSITVGIGPAYTEADCDDVAAGIGKVAAVLLAG